MPVTLPKRNRHWLKECEKAYSLAARQLVGEKGNSEEVYKLAPEFVAKARTLSNRASIEEMKAYTEKLYHNDVEVDPMSARSHKFHFVMSYVHSHVVVGLIEEMEADRIVEYVNDNTDLFPEKSHDGI